MTQQLVPQNTNAEEATLGSILIDPQALERVEGLLTSDEFYIVKNRWIYEACLEMHRRGEMIDFVTLSNKLEEQQRLKEIGGTVYLTFLVNTVPSALNIEAYAQIVKGEARRRALLRIASQAAQLAYDSETHVDEAIGNVQAELIRLAMPATTGDISVPAVPPLPASVVIDRTLVAEAGSWLDEYVTYAQRVAPMTPEIFHESAGLFLASMVIARRLVLPLPFADIYPNLWIMWVAPTTIWSKTTALNITRRLALRTTPFLLAPEELTPEAMLSDMSGAEPGNYMQMPLEDQENWQLRRNHAAQRGWTVDEFSGMLASAGRDYNAGLLETLLRFYDCTEQYTRLTNVRGMQVVHNSYLAILGASTPAAMAMHLTADRLWGIGWWPRFAILTPAMTRPEWQEPEERMPTDHLERTLRTLYENLPEAKWPEPPVAKTVLLDEYVYEMWNLYNRAMRYELLDENLDTRLWGTYGRMPVHVLKIAMILASLDWDGENEVRVMLAHLSRALMIAEGWRVSAHRALLQANEQAGDQAKMRMLYHISRCEPAGVTMRDLCKSAKNFKPSKIQAALDELILAGEISLVERVVGPRGGRPCDRYYLYKG